MRRTHVGERIFGAWAVVVAVSASAACGDDLGTSGATTSASEGTTTAGATTTTTSSNVSESEATTDATASAGTGSASATTSTTGDPTTSTTSTSTTDSATDSDTSPDLCGNGELDPGEACDDALNDGSYGGCMPGCAALGGFCGDGEVNGAEGCDDGNQIDDDACTNACALASCGDGKVQPGEACDDGDDDDTDACLSTCVEATCGDGFVQQGVELCDDGNSSEADECTSLCAPPSCDDQLKSGAESDVDCGGPCDGCGLGQGCAESADCGVGLCAGEICVLAGSCKALKEAHPGASSGLFDLDPDGQGPNTPFKAYCDMDKDGGGWTLVMRFAPQNSQFNFYNAHWTMSSVVNGDVTHPEDPSDGKFPAYNAVIGGELRGCMQHPGTKLFGCKAYPLPMQKTPLDLFANTPVGSDLSMKGLYFKGESNAQKLEWLTIQGRTVGEASIAPNYVEVGINIDDDQSCYDARIRFGLVLNNEANVVTLNDAAGFGAQSYYTAACDIPNGTDAPWRTASGFAAGPNIYHTAGQLWIR